MKLSKELYWLLSLTWGLPLTLMGLVFALCLSCFGKKPKHNMYGWVYELGPICGGFSLGPITIAPSDPSLRMLNHEFGHSIQNCYFGLLMPFVVSIPSMLRFWYRELAMSIGHKSLNDLPPYDAIWFEGTATSIGNEFYVYLSE